MSQNALNPEQFSFAFTKATPRSMDGDPMHRLTAMGVTETGPWRVGEMSWHHRTGEIMGISTYEPWRRQGVATRMLGEARRIAGETRGVRPPRHSEERTDAGEAWARSLGERLPRRKQV